MVSSIGTVQLVRQMGVVYLYFNLTLAAAIAQGGASVTLATIADPAFLPDSTLVAYPAATATLGAGWLGRVTNAGAIILHQALGSYASGASLNGVASFPARLG